jgi:hypothetical protein
MNFLLQVSFNAISTSSHEWLIDSGTSYHMAEDKGIFYALNECNIEQIFVGDDRSLSVVGSRTVQLDDGHFYDVLCSMSFLQPCINVSNPSFR